MGTENNLMKKNSKMKADLKFIRNEFPSLRDDYVYFDNAGGSQTLGRVINKVTEYFMTSDVQLGGVYSVSKTARERVDKGNEMIAKTLNASNPREVIVGSSSTSLIRLFSIVIGQTLEPGDEIIISDCDHEANVTPWKDLQRHGIIIKTWGFDKKSMRLELDDLKNLMTEKTKYVNFCHALFNWH